MERRRSTSDSAEAWSVRRDASRRHERSRQGLGVCELFVHRMENAPKTRLQTRGTTLDHGNGDVFLITTLPSTLFPSSYFLSRKRLHCRRDKRRWNKKKQRSGILFKRRWCQIGDIILPRSSNIWISIFESRRWKNMWQERFNFDLFTRKPY